MSGLVAPGPTLTTERLLLRPPGAADFDAWARFSAEYETMRFLGGVQPPPTAWRGLATMAGSWVVRGYGMFSVLERRSGQWLGRIGPWQPEGWPGTEVGWGLLAEACGRGYAFEAAVATIDWAFDALGWTEVIHCIAPDNVNSARLAGRLGARREERSQLPPPLEDVEVDVWRQSRAAWRVRRRQG